MLCGLSTSPVMIKINKIFFWKKKNSCLDKSQPLITDGPHRGHF